MFCVAPHIVPAKIYLKNANKKKNKKENSYLNYEKKVVGPGRVTYFPLNLHFQVIKFKVRPTFHQLSSHWWNIHDLSYAWLNFNKNITISNLLSVTLLFFRLDQQLKRHVWYPYVIWFVFKRSNSLDGDIILFSSLKTC